MRVFATLAMAAMTGLIAMASAADAVAEEKEYATAGRWRIVAVTDGNRFHYCAADTDNNQVTLRIATDGQTWQIGNPYYDNGPVRGQWGFDGWEDDATFRTDGDGWAVMDANQHILNSLRSMNSFSIQLDRGPQHWKLNGASAAMDKAMECARNRGRPQQASNRGGGGSGGGGGPKPNPGQVVAAKSGESCPFPGLLKSFTQDNRPATVRFVNDTRGPIDLYWANFEGKWVYYATVAPGTTYTQQTYTQHAWIGWRGRDCTRDTDRMVDSHNKVVRWK